MSTKVNLDQYENLTDRMRVIADRWWMAGDLGRTLRQAADAMENQQIRLHAQQDIIEKQRARVEELTEALRTAQAAGEAAVKDLAATRCCTFCVHVDESQDCEAECMDCAKDCVCRDCRDGDKFIWRGIQREVDA